MSTIEKAIYRINAGSVGARCDSAESAHTDARMLLIVTILFIVTVLSIPVTDPASLLWLLCYPIICAERSGKGYAAVLKKSLYILPLVALVGIFNPIFDRDTAFTVGSVAISRGWLTFAALLLRGLLAFQALLLLIGECGFYEVCRCLQWMRCPKVLVTQLLMLYRYIGVLLRETLSMQKAREARGFGRKSYPLRMWGVFAGQLLLRSLARARRVNAAMVSRGFSGVYHFKPFAKAPDLTDWVYLFSWIAIFAALRFIDITAIIGRFITHTTY